MCESISKFPYFAQTTINMAKIGAKSELPTNKLNPKIELKLLWNCKKIKIINIADKNFHKEFWDLGEFTKYLEAAIPRKKLPKCETGW